MTLDKVKEVLISYDVIIRKMFPRASAERCEISDTHVMTNVQVNHLLWMVTQAVIMCGEGRTEKAMRWLGFLQGAMWSLGIRSVEELKKDNMPAGEEFKP